MFELMCEYKGKDDIRFIAKEFVEKENTIYKLEEYIDQLESRLEIIRIRRDGLSVETGKIESELGKVSNRLSAKRSMNKTIEGLKQNIADIDCDITLVEKGFEEFAPTFQQALIKLRESHLNVEKDNPEETRISFSLLRGNLLRVLGELEKYIVVVKPPEVIGAVGSPLKSTHDDNEPEHEKERSEKNHHPSPQDDTENPRNELLNYSRLKELAADIISRRGSLPEIRKR